MQITLTTNNSAEDLEAFFKLPEIFNPSGDDLTPAAEQMHLAPLFMSDEVLTFAVRAEETIVGIILFIRYTSIAAEIHVGFLKGFRGKLARLAIEGAITQVFEEKGMLKIIARIPAYTKGAIILANALGFQKEGCLTESVLKDGTLHNIIIYGLTKNAWSFWKRAVN